jgi:hypothetical protein
MRLGDERGAIHQANLIPPGLLNDQPDVYQPYLVMREHVIDRLYHDNCGTGSRIYKASNILPAQTRRNCLSTISVCRKLSLSERWNA